jgi:hypothetical protein
LHIEGKGKVIFVCAVRTYRASRAELHALLTGGLDGGEWSTLHVAVIPVGKKSWFSWNKRLNWPQNWLVHYGEEKNLFRLPSHCVISH